MIITTGLADDRWQLSVSSIKFIDTSGQPVFDDGNQSEYSLRNIFLEFKKHKRCFSRAEEKNAKSSHFVFVKFKWRSWQIFA